mmetsp:Transcript_19147/g.30331  ORF Transcript_19147/g.30331 Transcript_19147/m.30331 type:complete len:256 (-) Transcript_19147:205-972(-)
MREHRACLVLVDGVEHCLDVDQTRLLVVCWPVIFSKARSDSNRHTQNLVMKQIRFVEEQNEGNIGEPFAVHLLVEHLSGDHHGILLILKRELIITRQRHYKDDARHIAKEVDPFSPLVALPADVANLESVVFDYKVLLLHACGSIANHQQIRVVGHVFSAGHAVQFIEEVLRGIRHTDFVSNFKHSLNDSVRPQPLQIRYHLIRQLLVVAHRQDVFCCALDGVFLVVRRVVLFRVALIGIVVVIQAIVIQFILCV